MGALTEFVVSTVSTELHFVSDDFRTSFFAHSQPSAEAASIYCIGGVCVFSMSVFLSSPTLPSVSLNRESSVLGVSLRCMCVVSSRLTFIVFADGVTCDTFRMERLRFMRQCRKGRAMGVFSSLVWAGEMR